MIVAFSVYLHLYRTLVISNSKGLSEILRNIRTSKYQSCEVRKPINRTTTFNKWICNLLQEQFLLFSTIFCYVFLDFHVKTGTRISLRDKRLFEISEVEITRVDCILYNPYTKWSATQYNDIYSTYQPRRTETVCAPAYSDRKVINLSRCIAFLTQLFVHPAETQVSLRNRSESLQSI